MYSKEVWQKKFTRVPANNDETIPEFYYVGEASEYIFAACLY